MYNPISIAHKLKAGSHQVPINEQMGEQNTSMQNTSMQWEYCLVVERKYAACYNMNEP